MKDRVIGCIEILEGLYGVPKDRDQSALDLLVATMLSQNTSDVNCIKAFRALKSAYPDYMELIKAPDEEVAKNIRVGGLSQIKAPRIKMALTRILEDHGSLDLDFLGELPLDDARKYLLSIEGVGPKTAAVVLLFAFGMKTMPVDTHVYRLSKRLGLVHEKASITDAQRVLEEITPSDKYLSFHINLIRHGRRVCKAKNPNHQDCALKELCETYRAQALNDSNHKAASALR